MQQGIQFVLAPEAIIDIFILLFEKLICRNRTDAKWRLDSRECISYQMKEGYISIRMRFCGSGTVPSVEKWMQSSLYIVRIEICTLTTTIIAEDL